MQFESRNEHTVKPCTTIQPNISKTMKTKDLKYKTETTDSDKNRVGFRTGPMK